MKTKDEIIQELILIISAAHGMMDAAALVLEEKEPIPAKLLKEGHDRGRKKVFDLIEEIAYDETKENPS